MAVCHAARHGDTAHFYEHHRCRCPAARAAHTQSAAAYRARRAQRRDDVDQVVVDRLVAGDQLTSKPTPAEKFAAFCRLTAHASYTDIATRLGISGATYRAYLARRDAAGIRAHA